MCLSLPSLPHSLSFPPASSLSPERASTSAIFCDAAGHVTNTDPLFRSADDADAADAEVGERAIGVLAVAPSRDVKLSRRPTSVDLRAFPKVVGGQKKCNTVIFVVVAAAVTFSLHARRSQPQQPCTFFPCGGVNCSVFRSVRHLGQSLLRVRQRNTYAIQADELPCSIFVFLIPKFNTYYAHPCTTLNKNQLFFINFNYHQTTPRNPSGDVAFPQI